MDAAHLDDGALQSGMAAGSALAIVPRGPFSWASAIDMLAGWPPVRRYWRGTPVLHMAFPLDGDFTPVAVSLWDDGGTVRGLASGTDRLDVVAAQVARMFSLDHDGSGYPDVGGRDPRIGRLMAALPGLRPVLFSSPYEAAAWAIISQRISMRQAAQIQGRLIAEYGHPLQVAGAEVECFPAPERLLGVRAVPGLGGEKMERLHAVARSALVGLLDAARLRALGQEEARAALRALPGIGPFWAAGIYLRACGIADVFPDEPLSIAALGHLHGLGDQPDAETLGRLTDLYRPYRMWVGVLLRVAAGRGLIPGMAGREGAIRRAARQRPRKQ